jgi:NAD(P)-dependent dehydrogenase (short-subunit alcohol dehydrogenase family)
VIVPDVVPGKSIGTQRRLLAGKAAIVTGAARGIGRATAVAFARGGAERYAQAVDDLDSTQPTAILETEAKKKLIAKTPLVIPWIEPEAIGPVVGATYDVTGGDSANYTA